ncbi:sodium-dependent lysophosphatidylcholine symporter 1-like isoform X2 [Triplophysa dalaica]|uniref:sodium-dependent lysophosphatidylcholine symporter 1-like isoform X2 n=1 Tax=Triplophysa dalaica TaxID=1582913 RepID=UPI0024DFE3C6|nr:sodium-dependent lysophosphatidylcholine symporter 1-like isoform X2 [Triplophysa dalaica]
MLCHRRNALSNDFKRQRIFHADLFTGCCEDGGLLCIHHSLSWSSLGCGYGSYDRICSEQESQHQIWQTHSLDSILNAIWGRILHHALVYSTRHHVPCLQFLLCYHVPYSSLNMFLGGNDRDRDSATGYRMGMEVFATLAGATIQGQIVGVYHAKRSQVCSMQQNDTSLPADNHTASLNDTTEILHDTRKAYVIAALVIGFMYFMCCLVVFLGVKEQLAPLSKLDRINLPYLTGMKMVVCHIPYVKLVCGFLFASLAFQMAQGNFALFCTHAADMGGYFQHLVIILLTAATLSTPLWQALLVKLGKKTTIFIGLSSYIPALILISLLRNSLPLFIIMSMLAGTSLAALFLLPWSMLPDVVDDFKVKNPSCQDLEPLFYSCFVFFNKFGGGVAVGISTMVLHFAGYKPGACKHNSQVIFSLRMLFAPVPICLLLISMVMFYFYPITEKRRQEIQTALKKAVADNPQKGEELSL